jgi:uncharacterized protein (TIGR02246 family)
VDERSDPTQFEERLNNIKKRDDYKRDPLLSRLKGGFMPAKNPKEVDDLFVKYMKEGDLESVLNLYQADVAFVDRAGKVKRGHEAVREELSRFVNSKQVFKFDIRNIIEAGDIALVHNHWEMISPQRMSGYAIEVMRKQSDGSWRFAVGDPFTLGPLLHVDKAV